MGYKGGFGGFGGGMGNMQNIMKQAQKMQADMQKAQDEIEAAELTGTAGGGMVEVTLSGKKELLGIKIKPEVVDPDDVEILEDLITAAFNDASEQADELSQEKLGGFGGMGGLL